MTIPTPIQLRRDLLGSDPTTGDLKEGELGYAYASEKLFIGGPAAGSVIEIGGGSVIALLTATPGVATADKAVILDSNTEIDIWTVVGQVEANTFKTSASVNAGFVKNNVSGEFIFGQSGEQSDLDLSDLADVTIVTPLVGEYLCFAGPEWVNAAIPFNDLSDVVLSSPVNGEILSFNGANWVNSPAATLPSVPTILDDLTDVDTTTNAPNTGDHLEFDGSLWVPAAPTVGGSTNLNALTDVTITSVAGGEFLRNDGAGQFVNVLIVEADISDLQSYALAVHTHVEADITDLQNYSLVGHTHVEADITDLQNYSLVGHSHLEADITDLQTYLLDITGENIGDLSDVDTTGISTGDHLIFNGTNWVPVTNEFIGLADTPPDYSGAAGLYLRVDSGAGFVEFVSDFTGTNATLTGLVTALDFKSTNPNATTPGFVKNTGTGVLLYGQFGGATILDELTDVGGTLSPNDGEVLTFVVANNRWEPALATSSVAILNAIGDVDVPAPSDGEVLKFNFSSGKWEAGADQTGPAALGGLTDVTLSSPSTNEVLTFTGSIWENQPAAGGSGATQLDELSDVTLTTPGSGDFLRNNGSGQFINVLIVEADISDLQNYSLVGHTHVEADITDLQAYLLNITSENIGDLADVNISSPTLGDHLEFDGSNWIAAVPSGGVSELDDLSDVDTATNVSATEDVLVFNGTNWVPQDEIKNITLDNCYFGILRSNQPTHNKVFVYSGTDGKCHFLLGSTDSSVTIGSSVDPAQQSPGDDVDLIFKTEQGSTGSNFVFLPGGSAPAAGLLGVDSSGNLLFDQAVGAFALNDLSDVTITTPAIDALLQFDGSQWIDQVNLILDSTAAAYLGNTTTNGSWRVIRVGNDLDFQRRESGTFRRVAQMGMNTTGGSNVNSVGLFSNVAGFAPGIRAFGTNADLEMRSSGTGGFIFNRPGAAAQAGLLGLNSSGQLLFNQSGGGATDLNSLTDVTISSPNENSLLVKSAGDWVDSHECRLTAILDANGNEVLDLTGTTGADNHLSFINGTTGILNPIITVVGTGTNVNLQFGTKGTGGFVFRPNGVNPAAGLLGLSASGVLIFNQGAPTVTDLDSLTDVVITSPATRSFLSFDGSNWIDNTDRVRIEHIVDSNNDILCTFQTGAGDLHFTMTNGTPGNNPQLHVGSPTETNVGMDFSTKGTGVYRFQTFLGGSWLEIENLTDTPTLRAAGPSPDANLRFETQGVGDFIFKPNGGNPSAGLLGVDSSGNLLFNQPGGASALNDLSDVTITSAVTGAVLVKSAGDWIDSQTPRLTEIHDDEGNEVLTLTKIDAASTNFVDIFNVKTGSSPGIRSLGDDSDIGFSFLTKGSGVFVWRPGGGDAAQGLIKIAANGVMTFAQSLVDGDVPEILTLTSIIGTTSGATVLTLADVASAVNSVSIGNSVTGTPGVLEIKAIGSDGDIDLTLHAKGTGAVKIAPGFDFVVDADGLFDGSIILTDAATDPKAVYWGDPSTNGSWRLILISGTLHSQKLITGTWTDEAIDGTP